jgi:lipid A 3-O-deacylase
MKTTILAIATACMALGAAATANAGEILGGVYAHGVGVKQSQEGGVDFVGGYRTEPVEFLTWIGKPAVHIIGGVNTNVSTDFIAAGFDWRFNIGGRDSRWYIQPGIGLALTNGEADIGNAFQPGISAAEKQKRLTLSHDRIDFGDPLLFEPELALGYRFSPKWNVELSYIHLSNGEIFHHGSNQGLDDIGLRLTYKLGAH